MKFPKQIFPALLTISLFTVAAFSSCSIFFPDEGTQNPSVTQKPANTGNSGSSSKTEGPIIETSDPANKRGLCYESLNEAEIKVLAKSAVSWVYNWGTHPSTTEDELFTKYGIEFIPMQWGLSSENSRKELRAYYKSHPNCKYLLGYNEPNLGAKDGGSGITPSAAAADWKNLEEIAQEFNLELVGPALQFSGEKLSDGKIYSTPKMWMDEFIKEYESLYKTAPRYDYFSLHCYMNWPVAQENYLKEYYNGKSAYNKKIWLTEFCAWEDNNGGQNESMASQTLSMSEKLEFMDSYDGVEKYAWFMANGNTNSIPFNSIFSTKNSDGTLTTLGQSYLNIKSENLLKQALDEAKNLLDNAQTGSQPGQYSSEAVKELRQSYEQALSKQNSSSESELKNAYNSLLSAIKKFSTEKIPFYTRSTADLTEDDFQTSLTKNLAASAFSASSESGTNSASKAFDSNFNTRWESSHADNQWLCIDFGEETQFNTIRIKWEAAYSTEFLIEVSDDGSTWETAIQVRDCTGNFETYALTLTQNSRYVRFYGKTRATEYGHSFYELGIFQE